jgi:hypothetical protein
MLSATSINLLIALGFGILGGLQKERAASPLAGLRTFELVSLLVGIILLLVWS